MQEATLVNAFNLAHALIDDVELGEVRKVRQPVHSVYIVEAKVNGLNIRHVLLIDPQCFTLQQATCTINTRLSQ